MVVRREYGCEFEVACNGRHPDLACNAVRSRQLARRDAHRRPREKEEDRRARVSHAGGGGGEAGHDGLPHAAAEVNRWESGVPWPRQLGFGEAGSAVSISARNVTIAERTFLRVSKLPQVMSSKATLELRANLKSISQKYHLFKVEFV